jgi:hypothetical protein
MYKRVKVSVVNSVVTLDFSYAEIAHEALVERVSEIAPVLEGAVAADVAKALLEDEKFAKVLPLVLAKDLVYQACLHRALDEVSSIVDVLAGRLNARQAGFPEFDAESGFDD